MNQKSLIITSLFILISIFGYSQDFPTKGEIYNYEVGDIFHYVNLYEEGVGANVYWDSIIQVLEINEKTFSINADTVCYNIGFTQKQFSVEYPTPVFIEDEYDSCYTNLSESVMGDTVINIPYMYNNRKIVQNYSFVQTAYEWITDKQLWVVGCGFTMNLHNWQMDNNQEYESSIRRLVYFKKGDEEWGEEHVIVGNPEISNTQSLKIFPNPTVDYLNVSCNNAIANSSILIFNTNGQLLLSMKLKTNYERISISCLSKGMYFVQQIDKNGSIIARLKFVKK